MDDKREGPLDLERRRFLKLILLGSGSLAAGFGLARHYGIFNTAPKADFDYKIIESRRPKADFEYKTPERTLLYVNPNSAEEILFFPRIVEDDLSYSWFIDSEPVAKTTDYSTKLKAGEHIVKLSAKESDERLVELLNKSYDPDALLHPLVKQLFGISDNLMYEWNVGGQKISNERDYSLKLSSGEHKIGLNVSDDRKQGYTEKAVTIPEGSGNFAVMQKVIEVDPDELYPEKELGIPIKGINYRIDSPRQNDEMEETVKVIKYDLGCNSIKIVSGYEDLMLACAKFAIKEKINEIVLSPRYEMVKPYRWDIHINEHIDRIIEFSKKANDLRGELTSIILCVGDELTHSVIGIAEAATYKERIEKNRRKGWKNQAPKENSYLRVIVEGVRENFKGDITYASSQGMYNYIKWDELGFDIIAPHFYFVKKKYTKEKMLEEISRLKSYEKPIYISEFGCMSYVGASLWRGAAWEHYGNKQYSQEEQAQNIMESMEIYQKAMVNGVFLWEWLKKTSDDGNSYGIMKYNEKIPASRKLGFFMYKKYVLPTK